MFNSFTYSAIDAVQTSKKQFVETFIKHEGIAKALNEFVDSQTKYTKAAVDAGIQTATSIGMIVSTKQFYDEVTNNMKSMVPSFSAPKAKSKKAA
jgi:hypothetical protein